MPVEGAGASAENTQETLDQQQQSGQQEQQKQGENPKSVDWASIKADEIPVDVIKKHPEYAKILSESVERRQKIKELKTTLEATLGEEPQKKPEQKSQDPLADNPPAWAKSIIEAVSELQNATQTAKREGMVNAALQANNLPEGAAQFVTGNTVEEINASAKSLAALMLPRGGGPVGGTTDPAERARRILANRAAEMKGTAVRPADDANGFYSPKVHARK